MFRKLLTSLMLCVVCAAYAAEKEFPQIIDFSKMPASEVPGHDKCNLKEMNKYTPFNGAIELGPYFFYLRDTYHITAAVETGTWQGETTKFLAYLFDSVYTMEIDPAVYNKAIVNLKPYRNIAISYGNSPDILRQILPPMKNQRALFYLDAHWFSSWPLIDELKTIAKTHRDNCIIVIDDFKVPGRRDIPYDSYGNKECSFEYVQDAMKQVFSSYKYYYLIPKSIAARAKFVAIPKTWRTA